MFLQLCVPSSASESTCSSPSDACATRVTDPWCSQDNLEYMRSLSDMAYDTFTELCFGPLGNSNVEKVDNYDVVQETVEDKNDHDGNVNSDNAVELSEVLEPTKLLYQDIIVDQAMDEKYHDLINHALNDKSETVYPEKETTFEYPPVQYRKSGYVGGEQLITIDGKDVKLITRSLQPLLFEIPDFLSPEECDVIIKSAITKGMNRSSVFNLKSPDDPLASERKSNSSILLGGKDIDTEVLGTIHSRVAELLNIPKEIVKNSEALQIGQYHPGGFYNAHLDSISEGENVPCCFQAKCKNKDSLDCCRICRYATVLYYLNDVEEGGETAFPVADLSFSEMVNIRNNQPLWRNLTSNCDTASVIIKPQKGKAIMWYNHILDRHGYIGHVNQRGWHGGCNVKKGVKWIATNWINTPPYKDRHIPSVWPHLQPSK